MSKSLCSKDLYCTFLRVTSQRYSALSLSEVSPIELSHDSISRWLVNANCQPTDQGSEYTSADYISLMNDLGVTISMSAKASPWENAYQESFYNNFKTDLGLEFERFETIGELVEAIHQTINYYNQSRIHTALKMPPTKFKHQYLNRTV